MKFRSVLSALLCAFAALSQASAKDCGGPDPACGPGGIPCACGDTVTNDYALTANLDCSAYNGPFGLKIASGKTLSLGAPGVQIIGSRTAGSVGVLFDHVNGAKLTGLCGTADNIKYLGVTNWERGVQLTNGATNNHVECVEAAFNGNGNGVGDYGVDLRVGGTTGNLLRVLYVHDNEDEGVHFGEGSFGNTLEDSTVIYNRNTQIYLTQTDNTVIRNNGTRGNVTSFGGIRLVGTTGSLIDHNAVFDGQILIDSNSSGNTLTNNLLWGFAIGRSRLKFQDGSHDNVVAGLIVASAEDHCIDFSSDSVLPYSNRITSSDLSCSGSAREIISDGSGSKIGQNLICDTNCRNQAGDTRPCKDSGTPTDDVLDQAKIVSLQAAACP